MVEIRQQTLMVEILQQTLMVEIRQLTQMAETRQLTQTAVTRQRPEADDDWIVEQTPAKAEDGFHGTRRRIRLRRGDRSRGLRHFEHHQFQSILPQLRVFANS